MYTIGVVTVLAAFLLLAGGLFYLMARRLAWSHGLEMIALGGLLMGVGFSLQLAFPGRALTLPLLVNHTATATGILCFLAGSWSLAGRRPLAWRGFVAWALGYTAAQWIAEQLAGATGRYLMLAGVVGATYALIAISLFRGARHQARELQFGFILMAVLATAMGSLNVIRAYLLSRHGMAALDMDSGFQQIFYTLVAVAAVVMTPVLVWMVFTRLSAQLKTMASTDALTGALNRHGLTEVLERHWRLVPGAVVVLLMIDIDHFKAINDQHGHPVGDAVLAMVARVIKAELGGMGHVARLGGEEFAVVWLDGDEPRALRLADRLRRTIARECVAAGTVPGGPLSCSVSIGVSRPCSGMAGLDHAMAEADRAMYLGKQAGRNQVFDADGRAGVFAASSHPPLVP